MLQKISHGAGINTATPEEVAGIVAAAFERHRPSEYRRLKGVVNVNAAGIAQTLVADLVVPSQYDLLLERVAFGGNGLVAATTVGVYENQIGSDADLLEWVTVGASLKYSDSFSNCIYVTANSSIAIVWAGATPNLQVTYNIQGRLIPAA